MSSAPIALVEPQSESLAHAAFNAALLHTVLLAYPAAPISFHAMPAHIRVVREILSEHVPEAHACIAWHEFSPPTANSLAERWRHSRGLLRAMLALRQRILLCSISRMQLLALIQLMRRGKHGPVRAVLHGDLEQIAYPPRERFPMSLFSLHRILLRPQPEGLRYLLLGSSIRDNIPARYEQVFAGAGVLDHPYHFRPLRSTAQDVPILGVFGNAGDGRLLEGVARAVRSQNPAIHFCLIGFVSDRFAVERLRPLVEDVSDQPIARGTFIEHAETVTHALWIAPPGGFRLRASGTFFDALSYAKPLIYTANPFIDAYFALAPEIGWRCESVADVPQTIVRLAQSHTNETYAAAQAAILRLRERFTPETQAKLLPGILDWE